MESILTTIKKMLGIASDYTHFDTDIIIHINSIFMTLNQLGVGPKKPVVISSELETWRDAFADITDAESIKTYTYLKVRMIFDPPSNSSVLEAMNRQASELEWRLNTQTEYNKEG